MFKNIISSQEINSRRNVAIYKTKFSEKKNNDNDKLKGITIGIKRMLKHTL